MKMGRRSKAPAAFFFFHALEPRKKTKRRETPPLLFPLQMAAEPREERERVATAWRKKRLHLGRRP